MRHEHNEHQYEQNRQRNNTKGRPCGGARAPEPPAVAVGEEKVREQGGEEGDGERERERNRERERERWEREREREMGEMGETGDMGDVIASGRRARAMAATLAIAIKQ